MLARSTARWSTIALSLALAAAACKAPPPPTQEGDGKVSANPPASAAVVRAEIPPELGTAFQCPAEGEVEGKGVANVGAVSVAAQRLLTVKGDPSPEARTLVVDGLCQRNGAFLGCLAKEREDGRFPPRATFELSVRDGAVSGVEGGPDELRACLRTAWLGSPAGAATGLSVVYVPGIADRPHPNVRARDVKAPDGVSVEVVAAKLRAKNPILRACYDMALREKATLAGTVFVEHDLGKDGKANKTRVKSGTLAFPSFEKCVEARLGDLAFGEPKGGKGKLAYTLTFALR